MVTYDYRCDTCGNRFEVKQHFDDPAPEACPAGHRRIHRVFSPPTVVFKGPGFYVTDNGHCSSLTKRAEKSDSASNLVLQRDFTDLSV